MARISAIDIVGAGPAGLYTAILLRRVMSHVDVRVTEQNPQGATFGFGVVFSDQALEFLRADDTEIHDLVTPRMERWRNMTLNHPSGQVVLDGVGFSAIGRLELIEILRQRAEQLGARMRFGQRVSDPESLGGDIVIGADGLNSVVRGSDEDAFGTQVSHFNNHFVWFGADRAFDTLTQTFIETEDGALNAHHYRYEPERSTFIVECEDDVFRAYGFAEMDEQESKATCQELFTHVLEDGSLICNQSTWRQFPRLWCSRWVQRRRVLLGDAAHTAHFSVGSGTRLAMEDAIELVRALANYDDVDEALAAYERERKPIARKIVDAANTSAEWYETFSEKLALPPLDFVFDYATRSGRIDMGRLRAMAPDFMARYDAERETGEERVVDPLGPDTPGAFEIGFTPQEHPNCSEILWANLQRNPDKPAVIGPAGSCTYRELAKEAARWGNAFAAAGLKYGERIPFFLDDTPVYPAAFFGAVRKGLVPVLLNIQTNADTLNFFLKDTDARIALCEASLSSHFSEKTLSGTSVETIVLVNGRAEEPGKIAAEDYLKNQPNTLECADTKHDDMAFWMYSSGSTGRPKGIVHLHHDMAYIQASYGEHVLRLDAGDVCFSVPKIYFAYGFGNSIAFPFSVGATTVLMPGRPSPGAVLDTIEQFKPTVFFGLPTLYTALCRAEGTQERNLSSIRQSMSAAEVLSEDVYRRWKTLVGHGPTEGFGSTEMLHIYLSNRLHDHRLGAAGARVPGYEIRLETPDGKPVDSGQEGVMFVRGHSSSPCYWQRPDKTRETMQGDWLYTGDRFIEKNGYYYFQGRVDELVKVSGQWVAPLEVEHCINDHPDVHESAVTVHELEDRRMTLRAVVRLKNVAKGDDATAQALQDYVKTKLQPYKYPRIVEFVDELPKTGTGKIDRQSIQKTMTLNRDRQ